MVKELEVISFHPGRQHNFEQACQVYGSFKKFRHLTGLYFSNKTVNRLNKFAPGISRKLFKRSSALPRNLVYTHFLPELRFLLKRVTGNEHTAVHYLKRNKTFQEWVVRKYAPPRVCIGFDLSSWIVFEKWKNKSFLILDLTIAIPQHKLTLAKENSFDDATVEKLTQGDAPLYQIYEQELKLADLILCGSDFVKASCLSAGVAASKLKVLPYGADLSRFYNDKKRPPHPDVIKVAFVGTVCYRKGADVLLKAWERLVQNVSSIELHFYGSVQMNLPQNLKNVFYHGHVDQGDLIEALKTAHISVLPTFFEGSSLAIYQSMAMGLAVVTTPNAGSIIKNNWNGLLVDYGQVETLCASLLKLATDHRFRESLVQNALHDIKKYTWDAYGEKLTHLLKEKTREPNYA